MKSSFGERRVKKSSSLILILASLFALVFLAFCASFFFQCSAKDKSDSAVELSVNVPHGSSAMELGNRLEKMGIIRSSLSFYLGARYPIFASVFVRPKKPFSPKSGVYRLSSAMPLSEIYDILTSGKEDYIKVSFPEGLTKSKIGRRLEEAYVCPESEFVRAVQDGAIIESYRLPSTSLEGYLFPDTYFFNPGMTGESVVRMMVDNFFNHARTIPSLEKLSLEELDFTVRLASIVEREYRIPEEAPLIASVFKNRIKSGWGLYSCATIEYIITEIEGKPHPDVITYRDLSIESPYNTYKWASLPPTAISNPGLISLQAVSEAPKTKYFYFRLADEKSGRHVFTEDFSRHISEKNSSSTKKSKE